MTILRRATATTAVAATVLFSLAKVTVMATSATSVLVEQDVANAAANADINDQAHASSSDQQDAQSADPLTDSDSETNETSQEEESCASPLINNFVGLDANGEVDYMLLHLGEWVLNTKGVSVSSKIQMRQCADKPIRGVFATDHIKEGEYLFTLPREVMITPKIKTERDKSLYLNRDSADEEYELKQCLAVRGLYDEFMKPEPENPYIDYLRAQPLFYVPPLWTPAGKEYLATLLPEAIGVREDLSTHIVDKFWDPCSEALDLPPIHNYHSESDENMPYQLDMLLHAWNIVSARAEDYGTLISIYDMVNHQNGHKLNTRHIIHDKKTFSLVASKDIEAGSEIFNSYSQCATCGTRAFDYGTWETFRDYGFVENYPQRYLPAFGSDARFVFDVDHKPNDDGTPNDDGPLVAKFNVPLCQQAVDFFEDMIQEMEGKLSMREQGGCPSEMPSFECELSWQIFDAHLVAFRTALEQSQHEEISDVVWKMGPDWYSPKWEEELITLLAGYYGKWTKEILEDDFYAKYRNFIEKAWAAYERAEEEDEDDDEDEDEYDDGLADYGWFTSPYQYMHESSVHLTDPTFEEAEREEELMK